MSKEIIFPPALKAGDSLRIIAPASAPKDWSTFEQKIESFKQLGFKISLGKNLRAKKAYLAGTDHQRLQDLHEAFRDKNVRGIICLRGGYGTPRLLDGIDYRLIRRNPKILCGFSDITALHLAILEKSRVGTFLGPNLFSFFTKNEFSDLSLKSFLSATMSQSKGSHSILQGVTTARRKKIKVVNPGAIKGWAVGGNLSLVAALVGTQYMPSMKGAVLFLEEVNEPAYRIDRLLTQLLISGSLKGLKGIVIGECTDCQDHESVFIERLKKLNIPMILRAPFGHVESMVTIPLGQKVEIK